MSLLPGPQHTQTVTAPESCSDGGKCRAGGQINIFLSLQVKTWDRQLMKHLYLWQESSTINTFLQIFHHNRTAKLCSLIPLQVVQFLYRKDQAQTPPKKWSVQYSSNYHAMQVTLKFNRSLRSFKAPLPISPLW